MPAASGQKIKVLLAGGTVSLRELRPEDVSERYVRWLNDPQVNQFLETRFEAHTLAGVRSYVQSIKAEKNEILWGIFLKMDGAHVGNIKLGPVHPRHKFAYIGLMIGEKDYWGKGIAAQAIALVTKYAFEELKLHKLLAGCYEPNVGSLRAFEKCGFHIEGTEKSQWLYEGKYIDSYRMAFINPGEGVLEKGKLNQE